MDVSVIIVNYNTCKMTQDCIDSIFKNTTDISYEVILIDNNSKDGSKEYFETESRIRYVYSFENMGFGRANNVGMLLAKGDYVLLLNSDTLLMNNAIKLFYKKAANKGLNFYGSWLIDLETNIVTSYGEEPTMFSMLKMAWKPYLIALGLKKKEKSVHYTNKNYAKDCEVGYVSGANMFFSRRIFEQYGAFDSNFFMYFEEAEWQKRLKLYGVKSYIIEGPQIVHFNGGSDISKTAQKKYRSINSMILMKKSRRYFIKKYYNIFQRLIFRVLFFTLDSPYIILSPHYRVIDKIRYLFN